MKVTDKAAKGSTSNPDVDNRDKVLKHDIPWETYMTAKLISGTGLQLLRRYDHKSKDTQASLLAQDGPAYIKTFVTILTKVTKEETVEYVLALIDDLLEDNPERIQLFHDKALRDLDIYGPFHRLLSHRNEYIVETSSKILTLSLSTRPTSEEAHQNGTADTSSSSSSSSISATEDVLQSFVAWLCSQLKNTALASRAPAKAIHGLSILLRQVAVRGMFIRHDGLKLLSPLIVPATSQQQMQLLYEAILCVWLLTFYEGATQQFAGAQIIPRLVEVAKNSIKEKVTRVAILSLKNLLPKSNFGNIMVDCGLPKVVQSLKLQAWTDEDLKEALDSLEESLRVNIKVLSSFEQYKKEVLSGALDWTPMHKDMAFWRENIKHFEEHDFEVLRILVTLLHDSQDAKTLAVACQDLGMFIQHHHSGKHVLLDLKVKEHLMKHMQHPDPTVQRQALLTLQKLLLSAKYVSYLN